VAHVSQRNAKLASPRTGMATGMRLIGHFPLAPSELTRVSSARVHAESYGIDSS
jgi:hypothetical protein